jgi:hypothetical protein
MTLPMEKITLRAKAINTTTGESEKGSRFVAVGMEIVDDENFAGETITWLGYLTEKTTARTVESLQHMGYQGDDLGQFEDAGADACAELLPIVVDLVCEPEEYEGKWTLKVQWVNRSGGGRFKAKKPLVGGELKAFAAQLKGAFKNARGPKNGAPAAAAHPNAPKGWDPKPPF